MEIRGAEHVDLRPGEVVAKNRKRRRRQKQPAHPEIGANEQNAPDDRPIDLIHGGALPPASEHDDDESYWHRLRWQFLIPRDQAFFNTGIASRQI